MQQNSKFQGNRKSTFPEQEGTLSMSDFSDGMIKKSETSDQNKMARTVSPQHEIENDKEKTVELLLEPQPMIGKLDSHIDAQDQKEEFQMARVSG